MTRWLSVVAVLLSVRPAAASQGEPAGQGTPPAAQESTLPVHDVGVSFGLGVDYTRSSAGTDSTNGLLRLNVAWSPLDWLEVSFFTPGLSVLLGSRHGDEVVLSAGLDGLGYSSVEGVIYIPSVGAAYRHWFSGATSLGVSARWSSRYSLNPPQPRLTGSVFLTHTIGDVVSLNFAIGGTGWSDLFGLTFGSVRPGVRSLPLVQVHLSAVWSIDLDARLTLWLHPEVQTALQAVLGFSAIW